MFSWRTFLPNPLLVGTTAGLLLLSSSALASLQVRFIGQTTDEISNAGKGFLVDNILVSCNGGTLYQQDFTGSLGDMTVVNGASSATNQWIYDSTIAPNVARWGNPGLNNFGTAGDIDNLDTPAINITACSSSFSVKFDFLIDYEESLTYDKAMVDVTIDGTTTRIADGTGTALGNLVNDNAWHTFSCGDSDGDMVLDTCGPPPTAPTNLTANATSSTEMDLSWIDNSSDETGFKIFRGGVQITTMGANASSTATLSDWDLTCGTTYNYEVKATAAVGDSSSATVSATTLACPISQTITFTPPATATVGDTVTLTATGGASGNPVTFASTTPSVCTVSGTTLTAVSAGTCTVTADQAGNNNYSAASPVSKNIIINEVVKTTAISMTPPLPNQMALFVQVDGTGSGSVSTDTGLYCTREDCPTNPQGEVVCNTAACRDIIDTGAKVILTPQADSGSVFTSWGGHEDCADGEILNFGRLCIAFFQKIYDLSIVITGQGKVVGSDSQGIDCGEGATSCSQSFSYGTTTYLQATPATGMDFLGWGGDCEGLRNPLAVKVVKEMKCEAQFGTVELPPVVVIPEPAVPLVPAEASTPTGEASTPVGTLVPAEASTPVGTLVPAEASTPAAEASTPVVPVIPIAALILGGASFSCDTTGSINLVCNYGGRPVTELDIQGQGMVSNGVLSNTLVNIGWVSNFTITANGKLTGGVVTGYIKNFGIMLDFDFKGMSIIGGTLGGVITNTSKVGGYFQDVTLLAGTKITGGTLKGTIKGDKKSPAVLEKVRVKKGSKLSGVKLGKDVKLEKGVVVE